MTTPLTKQQWHRVLDKAIKAGLLTSVDPEQLMPHLRQGGLTACEEEFAMGGSTRPLRMTRLEKFVRTRPSLEESLCTALKMLLPPLRDVVDDAIRKERSAMSLLDDAERFRAALHHVDAEMQVLAKWALPHLLQEGCLSRSDHEEVTEDGARLAQVLADKKMDEWRRLVKFLDDNLPDMVDLLRRAVEISDIMVPQGQGVSAVDQVVPDFPERIDIHLIVPGSHTLLHAARPDDTVGSLVDHLRRCGRLHGVTDLHRDTRTSLTRHPNWRQRTLRESGVEPGASLTASPVRVDSVRVVLYEPTQKESEEERTVRVDANTRADCDAVVTKFKRRSRRPVGTSPVMLQTCSFYLRDRSHREAIWSYSGDNEAYAFMDEQDGVNESSGGRTHILLHFISYGSGIRAAPAHIPVLEVRVDCEVLAVGPDGQLHPCSLDDLLFPTAVLMIRGLRLKDDDGATAAFFVEMSGGEFADSDTGRWYCNANDAADSKRDRSGFVRGNWSHAYVLLRSNDHLPRYTLPQEKTLAVYIRFGMEVRIQRGRVMAWRTADVDAGSIWIGPCEPSALDKDVTSQMRR